MNRWKGVDKKKKLPMFLEHFFCYRSPMATQGGSNNGTAQPWQCGTRLPVYGQAMKSGAQKGGDGKKRTRGGRP